jgi:hypothetical protein
MKQKIQPYLNKPEDDLLRDIQKVIKVGKEKGTLDKEDIDKYAAQLAPLLNAQQKEKMKSLLTSIKNEW